MNPSPTGPRGAVMHRRMRQRALPMAVSGQGCWIVDAAGRRYLDGSSGSGISCLGHAHPAIVAAMHGQLDRLVFAHTSFFSNAPMEELASSLARGLPGALVWFTSSGAEGVDAALKMVRQYFVESGQPGREVFIGREGGYLGASIGALAVGGHLQRRALFQPLLPSTVRHAARVYAYRDMRKLDTEEAYALRTADELEELILRTGPDKVAAFVAETVVGSTLGAVTAPAGYWRRVREICDRYGVQLILDEVMCGMGRTGTRFAFEQEGMKPDAVVLGKGLAGGYAPLGAVLAAPHIAQTLKDGSGSFRHGHSAHGHALACAAGLAVQREVERADLLSQVQRGGQRLKRLLEDVFGRHPNVGDIRGRGLMLALEIVRDRTTREPFEAGLGVHARVKQAALDAGLICYPSGGGAVGDRGDHIMLMPPFIVSDEELDELVDKLGIALDRALAEARNETSKASTA